MATSTQLIDDLWEIHAELKTRLREARAVETAPGQSRRGCPPIDQYCSRQARHLHAVDAVLVPMVRRTLPDSGPLRHDYRHAVRELEVVLAHVKAHEYGSAYESSFDWGSVWDDVEQAGEEQWRLERRMAEQIGEAATDDEIAGLAEDLAHVEQRSPSRPHPYLPHTGLGGALTRQVMRAADSFWDAVEGRFVPQQPHPAKKKPGLIGQYILADPRFDEEDRSGEPTDHTR